MPPTVQRLLLPGLMLLLVAVTAPLAALAQPPPINNCGGVTLAVRRPNKPVAVGDVVQIKATLRSYTATLPGRAVVQVTLPPGLCPLKTKVFPSPKKFSPSAAVPNVVPSASGTNLFWMDVPMVPRRGGKKARRFNIMAYASSDMALGAQPVNASFYILPNDGGFVPDCLTTALPRTLAVVPSSGAKKAKAPRVKAKYAAGSSNCTWAPGPPPTPTPGFELYAVRA